MLGFIIFAIGASVGSFLNVVADRLPAGQSLVEPRSHCPNCQRPLPNIEMVPVFSYLWLRGRCRNCGVTIPRRLFVIELLTGAIFTLVYLRFGLNLEFVVISASASLLVAVAIIDLEHKLILNRMVLPALLALIIVAPFWNQLGQSRTFFGGADMVGSLANSLASGVGSGLLPLAIFLAYPQGMGGGDWKLATLLGVLLGYPGIIIAWWLTAVSGGVVAAYLLIFLKRGRKHEVPYGVFFSFGGILTLLWGGNMLSFYQGLVNRAVGLN